MLCTTCGGPPEKVKETRAILEQITYDPTLVGEPVRDQIESGKTAVLEASKIPENTQSLAQQWRELGMLLHAYQLRLAALRAYRAAQKYAPDDAELTYLEGLIQLDLSAPDEAVLAFEKTLKLSPANILAKYQLAELAKNQGRLEEALAFYEAVVKGNDQFTAAYLGMGEVSMQLEQMDKAEGALKQALEIQPRIGRAYFLLAQIYREAGELEKAEQALEEQNQESSRVYVRDPLNEQVRALGRQGEQWMQRGDRALRAGEIGEALDAYMQAVAFSPRDFNAIAKLGNAHLQNGEAAKARELYQQALDINPSNALLLFNLGSSWMEVGNFSEAQNYFEKALKLEDLNEVRMRLADCHRLQGQWSKAQAQYAALLAKRASFLPAMLGMAVCMLAQDDQIAARDHLLEAWEKSEQNPVIGRVLVRVLAGYPQKEVRDGRLALDILSKIEAEVPVSEFLELKAMALAESGRFGEAKTILQEAGALAQKKGDQIALARYQAQMQAYHRDQPLHQALPIEHPLFRQSTY